MAINYERQVVPGSLTIVDLLDGVVQYIKTYSVDHLLLPTTAS